MSFILFFLRFLGSPLSRVSNSFGIYIVKMTLNWVTKDLGSNPSAATSWH